MAKLTDVFRSDEISFVKIGRRQLPLVAGDNLMMIMDLNSKGLVIDSLSVRGKQLENFVRKYNFLTDDEVKLSLEVESPEFMSVLSQSVQCVGCRRSVERLFYQLMLSGHPTLDPIIIKSDGTLTLNDETLRSPQAVCTLLYKHNIILDELFESQRKTKNNLRCFLHSLDSFRLRPFSETWRDLWYAMKKECKDELTCIETKELYEILEGYLKKHKFCQECRTKVEKAYNLLIGECRNTKEKGFVASLYSNIRKCVHDKHIHLQIKAEFIAALIKRAEPEINGSYSRQRERHAKTLEIAQEEVLTCVGMCIYERMKKIYVNFREEERACHVLAAVASHALCRSFDIFVEKKQGISNLELLYQEISRAEKLKEYKKEQKKLKKRRKKIEKRSNLNCNKFSKNSLEKDVEVDIPKLESCRYKTKSRDTSSKSVDSSYSSESSVKLGSTISSQPNSSDGSEVSCSEDLCSHELQEGMLNFTEDYFEPNEGDDCVHCTSQFSDKLSLEQMLESCNCSPEKEEECFIPDEVVLEFKYQENKIKKLREELRENLRQKFAQLCMKTRMAQNKFCD